MELQEQLGYLRGTMEAVAETVAASLIVLADLRREISVYAAVQSLAEAEALLAEEGAGWRPMWPSKPTSVQMTGRKGRTDGKQVYMYLYWRAGQGPAGRNGTPVRKTYIGADPAKQTLARAMIGNRERWARLTEAAQVVEMRVRDVVAKVGNVDREAQRVRQLAATLWEQLSEGEQR